MTFFASEQAEKHDKFEKTSEVYYGAARALQFSCAHAASALSTSASATAWFNLGALHLHLTCGSTPTPSNLVDPLLLPTRNVYAVKEAA